MSDLPNIRPATAARVLAQAMPYLREYHGKVLVVRFGGRAMADTDIIVASAKAYLSALNKLLVARGYLVPSGVSAEIEMKVGSTS